MKSKRVKKRFLFIPYTATVQYKEIAPIWANMGSSLQGSSSFNIKQ